MFFNLRKKKTDLQWLDAIVSVISQHLCLLRYEHALHYFASLIAFSQLVFFCTRNLKCTVFTHVVGSLIGFL